MAILLTNDHLIFMNIGQRYWSADLSKATAVQRKALRGYVRSFRVMIADGTGVFLCGPNGSGKTYLAAGLLKHAWSRWRVAGYCVTAPELKQAWISPTEAQPESNETVIERAERVRLLVIDDLGKEYRAASGFVETQIGGLVRMRSRRQLTTIVTTNMTPDEFSVVYGKSTAALLSECMALVVLDGPDMREVTASRILQKVGTCKGLSP